MALLVTRMAYTQAKRRGDDDEPLPLAANIVPQSPNGQDFLKYQQQSEYDNKNFDHLLEKETLQVSTASISDSSSGYGSDADIQQVKSMLSNPIAIYPQYLTSAPLTVIIDEVNFPKRNSAFEVHTKDSNEHLFTIKRDSALTHRQCLIDAKTQENILKIRHERGTLPAFYSFSDPTDTKFLMLEGNFSVPGKGSKATAIFTNAITSTEAKLKMKGSSHNRHATITDAHTEEVLATMESSLSNAKNILGRRRTYNVTIAGGVDMALIVSMISALDARA